ncbi:hypothetical protein [Mesobacterium pallidum]|uniref:hypothetical protein n=1 Tax=Mesobacterium pallidum TaxID=2872037 RepID=UPI001EE2E1EB|nr:hypothetical protein [Mesobacterium pallidum]
MTPYYVRVAGTKKMQGIFWAETLLDLFWAVDEMGNPYDYEYAEPRMPGGLWHDAANVDTPDSRPYDEEADDDGFTILPIGESRGENTAEELTEQDDLEWITFPPSDEFYDRILD